MCCKLIEKGNLKVLLNFLGAAGTVTGSATLMTIQRGTNVKNILVDCGLFQGEDFPKNDTRALPKNIDYVLLTHAHLDHSGGIPILYKNGYNGKVYGSEESLNQAAEILRDSAILNSRKMQLPPKDLWKIEKNIEKDKEKALRRNKSHHEIAFYDSSKENVDELEDALYLLEDAEKAIQHFQPVPVLKEYSICEGVDIKLIPNSHINGATMIEIYITMGIEKCNIVFTGDIGKRKTLLYKEFVYPEENNIDFIVMESLHGAQEPDETFDQSFDKFKAILRKARKQKKNVYVGVFALDRSAQFVGIMNQIMDTTPNIKKCYFDSPLGEKEFLLYQRSYLSKESEWFDYEKKSPFSIAHVGFPLNYEEHMRLVKADGPIIVLTSSCMGYGGRIVDYFKEHIQDDNAIFVFPGYLPEESPSKILCNANKGEILELNGDHYVKHCETHQLHGFSSHGYFQDKLEILQRYSNVKAIFLNHAEDNTRNELYEALLNHTKADIVLPEMRDKYELSIFSQE